MKRDKIKVICYILVIISGCMYLMSDSDVFLLVGMIPVVIICYLGYLDLKEFNNKYPNHFWGYCGYCKKKHGRNKWWLSGLDYDYCEKNGFIFLDKTCLNNWKKENIICEICNKHEKYSERTISHKFKRDYYYFCNIDCKDKFRNENPDLFYEGYHRHSIPSDLRKIIWNRDGGQCVKCGSKEDIHYDHIIPVSKGGSTTEQNLELLCQQCNLSKTDKIE